MSTAVLEFNDQALLIKTQDGELFSEPGFALHSDQGIITGLEARQQAWLQPQNIYRQYWRQLNQSKLDNDHQWARHHADIAFAQLKNLAAKAGSPEQLILSVPATFDDQQLSLLLGLISAIPATVVAIVDTALADCLSLEDDVHGHEKPEKHTLHVDLHMHQLVVSQISFEHKNLRIKAHQIIPDIGAAAIYNALAGHIRDLSIKNYRFDPLHTSEGEQAIYNLLPDWIMRFGNASEYSLTLPSPRGDISLVVRKRDIETLLETRLQGLTRLIKKISPNDITYSHNSKLLSTLNPELCSARELSETQGIDNCLSSYEYLLQQSGDLHRITSLKQTQNNSGRRKSDIAPPAPATHLFYQGRAWPLNEPLSITIDGKRLNVTQLVDNNAALVLSICRGELNVIHLDSDRLIQLPNTTEPGEELFIGDHRLQLIEVFND